MQGDTAKHLHVKHTTIKNKDANQWNIGYSSTKHWHGKTFTDKHSPAQADVFCFTHFWILFSALFDSSLFFRSAPCKNNSSIFTWHKNVPHSQ